MSKNIWVVLGLVMLGGGMCLGQTEQPSLAELAKQNKSASKAVKTFTEADLPSTRANVTETAPPVAQSASSETTGSADVSDGKKASPKQTRPESKDAPAVAELKKQIDSYKQDEDMWKKSAKRYEDLLANETNDFRRQTYTEAMENDKKNIAFYQQKVDQSEAALSTAQKTASSSSSNSSASPPGQP
jgi:hypothetical protein